MILQFLACSSMRIQVVMTRTIGYAVATKLSIWMWIPVNLSLIQNDGTRGLKKRKFQKSQSVREMLNNTLSGQSVSDTMYSYIYVSS